MRLAALLAVGATAGGIAVTTPPRPPFPGPMTSAPEAKRLVVVSSRYVAPALTPQPSCETSYRPPKEVRGLPLQRTFCSRTNFAVYGKDGASARLLLLLGLDGRPIIGWDFKNYVWPPRIQPGEREFVYEEVVWATYHPEGVYYVESSHSTYARSSYGRNGYITAIDSRGKRLWRSKALVANAQTFEVGRDYLITGYGFTAEDDWLYLLDRRTGRVVERLRLPSAPERIEWIRLNNTLRVRTYDHVVVVRLKGS